MRYAVISTLLLIVIGLSIWNEVREDHDHKEFFTDMRDLKEFIQAGPRFTNNDAIYLCNKLSESEEDCEKIVEERPSVKGDS